MKKTFLLLPLALTLIIGTGSAVFVFSSGNSSIEDNNVNVKFDDIRDNYELGEEGDPDTYIKKFNVYFFSQSDFTPGRNSDNNGPENIYYKENTDSVNYGSFDDGSYYKLIKDVTVLYASDVLNIGEPKTTLNDEKGYNIVFNGWSLTNNIGNYTGLNSNAVTGNFPYNGSSSVNLMSYGSSIELFINRFKDSDGNNLYGTDMNSDDNNYDLYLYPIYTTGKCYVSSSYKNNPLRVEYFAYEDENNQDIDGDGNANYLSYNDCFMNEGATLNNSLDEKFDTDITCYYMSPLDLDNITHFQFKYSIYNSSFFGSSWSDWVNISYGSNNETNFINIDDDMLSRLTSDGVGNGKYSIFSFVKVTKTNDYSSETTSNLNAAKFTDEEITYIENLLENDPYVYLSGNAFSIRYNNFTSKVRYYINVCFYFTRLYEPKLIGGPTNSLSYNVEHDKQYNFVLDSNYSNIYSIDNVKFDPDNSYLPFDENCSISKAVFGIELDSTSNFDLDYKIGDYNSDPLEGRYSLYNNFNYLSKINEIESITDDIAVGDSFDELTSNNHLFVINKSDISSHNVGYGTYSLAIKIEYENQVINGHTVKTPSAINVYVYRQHDAFIAIYGEEAITSSARNNNIFIEPDLDGYTKIDFIALYVYRNAPLEYDEEMYFDVNGLIEVADEESGTNGYVTLREIVAYYDSLGYELYDRLTGFIINDESMSNLSFKTTKNLVFQIRERK